MRTAKTPGGLTMGTGFGEEQRTVWCKAMPLCTAFNQAMQDVADLVYTTSDQHREAGAARKVRDMSDISKLTDFFKERSPFCTDTTCLRNIVTGEVAGPKVDVDRAKVIGQKIIDEMTDKKVESWSFKRKDAVTNMVTKPAFVLNNESVKIDQELLFQRLSSLADRLLPEDDSIYEFELCTFPQSLFDSDGIPLKAVKGQLQKHLWTTYHMKDSIPLLSDMTKYVIDGGALLHLIPWPKSGTIGEVLQMYVRYINDKYQNATIVFDGYHGEPTTKDITHQMRKSGRPGVKIVVEESTQISTTKDEFFLHDENKQALIDILGPHLRHHGHLVLNARDDADCMLVRTAIEAAGTMPTVLVGDDTDLLCLLVYHGYRRELHQLALKTSVKEKADDAPRVWNIQKLQERLGEDIIMRLLFVHAFSGCDTTSRFFNTSKGSIMKLLDNKQFQKAADVFMQPSSTQANVTDAGEKAVIILYDGVQTKHTSLTTLRSEKYRNRTSTSKTFVRSCGMPPTSSAAKQHSLRVRLQIMVWLGHPLNPKDWGWQLKDNKYCPKYTDKQPGPDSLLKVIRCACKTGCSTARCSCRKNGLDCTSACKECKGTSCSNIALVDEDILDDTAPSMDVDEELSLLE